MMLCLQTHVKILQQDADAVEHSTIEFVGSCLLLQHRIEGARAYVLHQACIHKDLFYDFKSLWHGVPTLVISQVSRDADVVLNLDSHMMGQLMQAAAFLQP
jgi:hypothetical protein